MNSFEFLNEPYLAKTNVLKPFVGEGVLILGWFLQIPASDGRTDGRTDGQRDMPTIASKTHYIENYAAGLYQESRAVARKPRDAAAVLFGLKFTDNIYYKFKSSQASKATLQNSKYTGAKQNLTQNGHSRSFTGTCSGVSGKAIRDLFVKIPTM